MKAPNGHPTTIPVSLRRYASATAIWDDLRATHGPALRAASDAATVAEVATAVALADLTSLCEDPT